MSTGGFLKRWERHIHWPRATGDTEMGRIFLFYALPNNDLHVNTYCTRFNARAIELLRRPAPPPLPEDNNLDLFCSIGRGNVHIAHTVNFVLSEMDFDKESNETVRVVHDQDAATCGDWTYLSVSSIKRRGCMQTKDVRSSAVVNRERKQLRWP
jgi:hypothetical protein